MSKKISQFIASIAAVKMEGLFNPWSQDNADDLGILDHRQRVKRLRSHINIRPDYLLIGEAPGYQGARYSGIPFTSERLLFEGAIPRLSNMKGQRISTRHRPWSEPSASIIWKVLHELGIEDSTILWNAVPWHPFSTDPHTNRTPTQAERQAGMPFLKTFIQLYPGAVVVAVGNTASNSLTELHIEHTKVRHPANGEARKFAEGLRQLMSK